MEATWVTWVASEGVSMAKTPPITQARTPLVQPNLHPESARSSGQKPARRALMQRIGRNTYIMPLGGSRPKP